ncbi:tetratricopeptide repeat protein [Thermodesulfobacteriota bacterium]
MEIPEKNIYEILDKNPSQETLHILLPVLMEKGKLERVIRECQKSLNRYPEDYIVRKILAEAYFADGKLPEAEAEADTVINGIENLAEAYRLKADILLSQKREREAVEYLERFIVFSPEDEKVISLLNSIQDSMQKDAGEMPWIIEDETDELTSQVPVKDNIAQDAIAGRKRKKEKLIKILDAWRSSFQKDADSDITAH